MDIEAQVTQFKSLTGVTENKVALDCLYRSDWDFNRAVVLFLSERVSAVMPNTIPGTQVQSSEKTNSLPGVQNEGHSNGQVRSTHPNNTSVPQGQNLGQFRFQSPAATDNHFQNPGIPLPSTQAQLSSVPGNGNSHGGISQAFSTSQQQKPEVPPIDYNSRTLQDVLNLPVPEINILILGETGVGKSTWINGLINYLSYSSLADAEKGELHTLIPTEFTVTDENFATIKVRTGQDRNEVFSAGQSATQSTQVYEFEVGKTKIRLLDTPGIGDTRGIDQDKKNFQNILTTLSYLSEIHGICILLKPNNARLTVMFRFCIKELLTYLHRDASNNILFCFTNSRGTFYRPGDTMPALLSLLKENQQVQIAVNPDTVYCFDSEAYRFLAAIKNAQPVNFPDEEKENFSRSWEKSIKETRRMLEHIAKLTPHSIQSTLSLNTARELVLKLVRPLAEVGRNIQINKKIVEDQTREIANQKADRVTLQQQLMTDTIELEIIPINHPKTVCSNTACKKIHSCGGEVSTIEYTQVCHDHCYLDGIAADTIGDEGLLDCWSMNGSDVCRHASCGHSYREHLHVYYESKQVTKQVEDQTVKNALDKNLSDAETKQLVIEAKIELISEFEQELKEIEKASVHFAYFLKTNAITPYNDAMEQYLDHLIREEKDKVAQGGSRHVMEALILSKDSYLHEKRVLEQALKSTSGVSKITPEEINKWVNALKNLKHSGKALEQALNCVNFARARSLEGSMIKKPGGLFGHSQKSSSIAKKSGGIKGFFNRF